jgi:hypothetical protein
LVDLIGSSDPDIIAILEKSMAKYILGESGSLGIVCDLIAVKHCGSGKGLAWYGHYYRTDGENREINFGSAVTRKHGIPVHHGTMSGNS